MKKLIKRQVQLSTSILEGELDAISNNLNNLINERGPRARLELVDDYEIGAQLFLSYMELETDAEYAKRQRRTKSASEAAKRAKLKTSESERKVLEKLAKKHGYVILQRPT